MDIRRFPYSSWNLHFKRKIYFFIRLKRSGVWRLRRKTQLLNSIPNKYQDLITSSSYFETIYISIDLETQSRLRTTHRCSTRELISWLYVINP